jgi:hypothetical protein
MPVSELARRDGDGDVPAAPPEPPPPPPLPPAAPQGGGEDVPPPLVRSPPVNPALVRAQRAEETLRLKLEVRPARERERERLLLLRIPRRQATDLDASCLQFLTEPELALILAATYAGVAAAWVCLLVTLLMKTKRTPLYHVPGGGGTRGFTIFNAALASLLLATTGCVAFYSARQWVRLRLCRRLRWADRSRAVAAAQR